MSSEGNSCSRNCYLCFCMSRSLVRKLTGNEAVFSDTWSYLVLPLSGSTVLCVVFFPLEDTAVSET